MCRKYSMAILFLFIASFAAAQAEREVVAGITTTRPIPGEPYKLAGNRIVFTNWYYIQPGDLDWRNDSGMSVYVDGNSGLYEAHHVALQDAPSAVVRIGVRVIEAQ